MRRFRQVLLFLPGPILAIRLAGASEETSFAWAFLTAAAAGAPILAYFLMGRWLR